VPRSAIPAAITEALTKIFAHSEKAGLTIAGWPFSRYPSVGPGLLTIECGVPLAAAGSGEGDVEAIVLPGGPAAFALHMGPYDKLTDTYVAIEQWMESSGARASGAPWEQYVNDPSDFPDPADWKTEVYWPLER
jgi:AraC family transcriptional regulator